MKPKLETGCAILETLIAPTNRIAKHQNHGDAANQTLTELGLTHSGEEIQQFVEARLGALLRVCEADFRVEKKGGMCTQLEFRLGEPSHQARQSVVASIETVLKDMLVQARSNVTLPNHPKEQTAKLVERETNPPISTTGPFTGEFAASLAHKLRNYLAAIISASEQLTETLSTASDRDSRQLAGMISRSAQSQKVVIDRFLEAFGPLALRIEKVDLHRCIGAALDNLRAAHGYDVSYQTESGNIRGVCDRTLLTRIVRELATNAAEATPQATASLRWQVRRNRLVIMLENDGSLAADESHSDYLKPFYSKKAGHSGLGLNIVQRATEALGGKLRIITLHKHTLFAVSIPVQLEDLTDLHTERNP